MKTAGTSLRQGGIKNPHQDHTIISLELTEQEQQDVVALLKSLNGKAGSMSGPRRHFRNNATARNRG